MKQRPGFWAVFFSAVAILLWKVQLPNTAFSPSSPWTTMRPLPWLESFSESYLGVKLEKVLTLFLLLILSVPCWTFQPLTGNTSKIVHTIIYLYRPLCTAQRLPSNIRARAELEKRTAAASSACSDHTDHTTVQNRTAASGVHVVLSLTLRLSSFDHSIQTNKNRNIIAGLCSLPSWGWSSRSHVLT